MITGAATEELKQLELGGAGVASLATATEAGELFAYHIDTPVSVPRQHSAMLPIVKFLDKPVTAQDILKEVETLLAGRNQSS